MEKNHIDMNMKRPRMRNLKKNQCIRQKEQERGKIPYNLYN